MSDLKEVIARWRLYLDMEPQYGFEEVPTDDLRCLLDAAEAAATARDAALEEALQKVTHIPDAWHLIYALKGRPT